MTELFPKLSTLGNKHLKITEENGAIVSFTVSKSIVSNWGHLSTNNNRKKSRKEVMTIKGNKNRITIVIFVANERNGFCKCSPVSYLGDWAMKFACWTSVGCGIIHQMFREKNWVCLFMSCALLHYAFVSESLLPDQNFLLLKVHVLYEVLF